MLVLSTYPTFENVSEEEYLVREAEAEYKSEYRDGRVVAMSGSSPAHNTICLNMVVELRQQLKNKDCQVFGIDVRTKINAARLYTYLDILVVCGEPRFDERDKIALLNPTLIIEVLSKSTEAYDRGEKFQHYKKVDTLSEYVLVSQNEIKVEHFTLENGFWRHQEICSPDGILSLNAIDCRVSVPAIYEKVKFLSESLPGRAG